MKSYENKFIIGVDHGYGNIKTANHCFQTGIVASNTEPIFTKNMLVYQDKYYLIGEGHKEFLPDKVKDNEYYLLTLAAIAMELKDANLYEADIIIAAGLPLTWSGVQKQQFAAYLKQNKSVTFTYNGIDYNVDISGVMIYPQGYAAIAPFAISMKGLSIVADIGNGTMNTLYAVDGKPQSGTLYTEKFGTYQCTLAIRETFMRQTQRELNDYIIDCVLRDGKADIPESDLQLITAVAEEYVEGIFRRLREHGYDASTMRLFVTGGGGCLIEHFYKGDTKNIVFVEDICAAAKGYEYLAEKQLMAGKNYE